MIFSKNAQNFATCHFSQPKQQTTETETETKTSQSTLVSPPTMILTISQQLRELLEKVEASELELRGARLQIRARDDELLDTKQLVEYWKDQAMKHQHGGASRSPHLIRDEDNSHHHQLVHQQLSNHNERKRTVNIDVVEFRAPGSHHGEMSITSSTTPASHRAVMTELYDAIDELSALPDDLLPVLIMMDNILKCKKYHRCLWLDATCESTQRLGHWTKLRLRSLKLKSHPALAFHENKWAPKTSEGLKAFVCLLVELCEEFQELCDNTESNSMVTTSCA
jgi:hypothetical protein